MYVQNEGVSLFLFTTVNLEVSLQIVWHSLQGIDNTPNIDGLTTHFADTQQKIILIISYVADLETDNMCIIQRSSASACPGNVLASVLGQE